MKKILFPTDFSDAARAAYIYALKFANQFGAEIHLLHVYDLPRPKGARVHSTLESIHQEMEAEKLEEFNESVKKLRELAVKEGLEGVRLHNKMKRDKRVVTPILREAAREEVDMIILGTQGATSASGVFFGSVAGEVLENASVPVLAVPQNAVFDGTVDRIGLTTEFSDEDEHMLKRVLKLAAEFEAKVFCVNVDLNHVEFYRQARSKWSDRYSDSDEVEFFVVEGDELIGPISNFFTEHNIDILAMLTHRRNFLQELFNYSDAKQMTYYTDMPILAIQAHTLSKSDAGE